MLLFFHTNKLEILEISNGKTDLPENLQDNGATPPVLTQPYSPHSSLEDASVSPAAPSPHPRVDDGNDALQVKGGDIPEICLLVANYMIYGVYQDWVHQNSGDHLYGSIAEESKWQAQWGKLVCLLTQRYDAPSGKVGKIFAGSLSVELDRVHARK